MHKRLLIMRHAKSDWGAEHARDFDRTLNDRGQRDVPRIAAWLKGKGIIPDMIVSSSAERAKQTSDILRKELGLKKDQLHLQQILYGAGVNDCLKLIDDHISEVSTLLLVAHNPTIDELVSYLSTEIPPRTVSGKLMTTAALAVFIVEDEILPNHLELEYLTRPKSIAD